MYKGTHQNAQRRIDHIRMAEVITPETITIQEEHKNLKGILTKINERIAVLPKGPERDELIKRQVELSTRAAELNKIFKKWRNADLPQAFMTHAKDMITPALFNCILNVAKAEMKERDKELSMPGLPVEDVFAPPPDPEILASCHGKVKFAARQDAEKVATRRNIPRNIYRCEYCRAFHLATP